MKFHPDQVTRINQWLADHVRRQCPACGLLGWWQIHDGCYGLPSISLDTLNLGDGLEVVATTCKGCGYTAFFLAARMGVGPRAAAAEVP